MRHDAMNKYKRLLSNTVILAVGTFSSKVLVYLLLPLYTAMLSPAEYSDANIISQIANLIMPVAAIGVCDGLFRFALDAGEKKREVFSSGITILTLGTLLFLAVSPLLFKLDMLTGYAWLAIIYVIAANYQLACANYIRALGRTTVFAVQGIINTALNIAFNILFLVVLKMGVYGYVLSVVVANVIVTVIMVMWQKLYRDLGISLFDRRIAADMLKYSAPMIPTSIFWWLTSVSGQFLVKYICGDEANGIFAASYKIPTVLTLMTTIFIEAWQYSAVADADDGDRGEFFSKVFRTYSGLIFMAASALAALAKLFASFMLANDYYSAWQYMPTLVIATTFSAVTTFLGSIYMVKKKSMLSFLTSMCGAVLNVGICLILVPEFGAQGAAIAAAVSYFAVFAIRAVNTQKYVRFDMHPAVIALNAVILIFQCAVMVLEVRCWIVIEAACFLLIFALNAKPIIEGALMLLRGFLGAVRGRGHSGGCASDASASDAPDISELSDAGSDREDDRTDDQL